MGNRQPVCSLTRITVRVRDRHLFHDLTWNINSGEHWAILGPNGSGKTTLARVLTGTTPVVLGSVRFHPIHALRGAVYVGPERYREYLEREHQRQLLWSPIGASPAETLARDLFSPNGEGTGKQKTFIAALRIAHLIDQPLVSLSHGEMRKVMLASAFAADPKILVLDEPFDGLDSAAASWLSERLCRIDGEKTTLILVTHRVAELLPVVTHVMVVDRGEKLKAGPVSKVLPDAEAAQLFSGRRSGAQADGVPNIRTAVAPKTLSTLGTGGQERAEESFQRKEILIDMRNITVKYDGIKVIDGLSWTVREGESWCIYGPNGSGKTTLLNLVCGDHPQAYANDIYIFGKKRGEGESIWEIKKRIGYMNPHLQVRYRHHISVRDVILSGFFDSFGLYRRPNFQQERRVEDLAEQLEINHLIDNYFDHLSSGERMIALIARAMAKNPRLLLLDEPCQGLDSYHRKVVLHRVDAIGRDRGIMLVFVTHHADDMPPAITHTLALQQRS